MGCHFHLNFHFESNIDQILTFLRGKSILQVLFFIIIANILIYVI